MNRVILMGRLTKDPEYREGKKTSYARYTLAVDRLYNRDETDFIPCLVFGKGAEFANEYLKKGSKLVVEGSIRTGSYKDKDGNAIYTTDVIVDNQEFAESKKSGA